jgi:spore germination protein GerM
MDEKIVIVVYGGVVQSVYSTNKDVDIDLLDFDNENFEDDKTADNEFLNRTKNLIQVL